MNNYSIHITTGKVPTKKICFKTPTQRHTTQYPDLFGTPREGFNTNTGNKKTQLLLMKNHHALKVQCLHNQSVKNNYYFPPRNDSNSFGTVHYDAHIYTKIDNSIDHVFKSMTTKELKTYHL